MNIINVKKKFSFFLFFFLVTNIFATPLNKSKVLPNDHWIYESLNILQIENQNVFFTENSMLTVGELKFYFDLINTEKLSQDGLILYDKCKDFFLENDSLIKFDSLDFDFNTIINTELYYKNNDEIDWTFNYNYKDNFLTFPIYIGFSDYVALETDLFVGKSHYGSSKADNFTNIPFREGDIEFHFPRFAYGSSGYVGNSWGANIHIGKEGYAIGNTKLGSIIYNNTFETDAYINLNLYSNYLKYTLNLVQISNENWLYLHELSVKPYRTLKFSLFEGSMINAPFEIRFLNPLMIMHQYSGWTQYSYNDFYSEDHFCAYLCFLFEWLPIKYFRLYGLFAQNEYQLLIEKTKEGILKPDSLGGQLGFEILIPSKKFSGWWNAYVESAYTSPYLYVKQTPYSSLIRIRTDNLIDDKIYSWIGLPDGPDTFALIAGIKYKNPEKFYVNLNYVYKLKGINDISLFGDNNKGSVTKENMNIYNYYPYVFYQLNKYSPKSDEIYDVAYNKALRMWPIDNVIRSNKITFETGYSINKKTAINSKLSYMWNFLHINEKEVFSNGIEIDISIKYNLL